nr:MAG TPA: large terminase [Bacteriophage sp.]
MSYINKIKLSNIIAPSFFNVHEYIKQERYTHYWLAGGRASTKSSFISIEIIILMMKDPMANCVILRKVSNTLKESVFNQILWALDMLGVSEYWSINKSPLEITYKPFGNKILFRGSDDPQKLKSTKFRKGYCKIIWYEEVTEFFGMEEIRTINQTLMRGGEKFILFYSYNPPKSINNWVNEEALVERDDKLLHKSTYLTVPKQWLGEPFFIEANHLKEVNELAYRNEYLGEATGTGGAVFTNLEIREITDEEISHFDKIYDGLDFGYAIDPSAYVQCYFDKARKRLYIFSEVYGVGLSNERLWEKIINKKISRATITADSAEPKSIDKLNSLGKIYVKGAKKGPDSVEYGIRWLQDLEKIIIDNKRCPNTAREFSLYELERDKYGNFKDKYPDKDNHSIDSTRYAMEDVMKVNTMTFGYNRIL